MHKSLTRILSALAVVACTAAAAFALVYPPGTVNGTSPGPFPDTLSIWHVQNPSAVPHPALLDTVYGIGGIVTGFDAKPSGFAFYLQTSCPGTVPNPYAGVDVFTGSFNFNATPFNIALGDSVIIYGRVQEFPQTNGGTEIEGLDGVQGSQDLAYRKINSGNPLPPFFVGNVNNLRELPTNPNGELWEGMLVRIQSPMRVARVVNLGTSNSFLLVDNTVPPASAVDSVFVDGNTLTTYAPPALGVVVDMVQGIYEQRARGYRIQLRDGNDITLSTPPNLIDAYPVAENQVRVVFDRNVTSGSATNTTNYTLGSFGSVDAAVMDGTDKAVLTITSGQVHGGLETVTAVNIAGLANGLIQTTPQTRTFVNGVLTCADVQAANPDSLVNGTACFDKSRFAGTSGQVNQGALGPRMTVSGTATGIYAPLYYLTDDVQGLRSGVSVFAPLAPLVQGRRYLYVGSVQEFAGESEVSDNQYIVDQGVGASFSPVTAKVITLARDTCDYSNALIDGEDYEGMLVKVPFATIVLNTLNQQLPTNGFHIAQIRSAAPNDSSYIFVSNLNNVLTPFTHPTLGRKVAVTGVLHYANGSFRICPRNYADIEFDPTVDANPTLPARVTFAAAPNPTTSRSNISFGLPRDADVELGVYDITGRAVASLARGVLPAGNYSRAWDGRASNGSKAPAGVYFYRLRVGAETFSLRSIKLGN